MKLINNTRIPDEVLTAVLSAAARALHKRLRTGGVVVQVTYHQGISGSSGVAYRATQVRWGRGNRWIKTDGGAFRVRLPRRPYDYVRTATNFFETARHEWGHIHDYQVGGLYFSRGRRRPAHDHRPEERRVDQYIARAHTGPDDYYDEIMQLAIEIEKQRNNE